jgi:hypothetical protein
MGIGQRGHRILEALGRHWVRQSNCFFRPLGRDRLLGWMPRNCATNPADAIWTAAGHRSISLPLFRACGGGPSTRERRCRAWGSTPRLLRNWSIRGTERPRRIDVSLQRLAVMRQSSAGARPAASDPEATSGGSKSRSAAAAPMRIVWLVDHRRCAAPPWFDSDEGLKPHKEESQ